MPAPWQTNDLLDLDYFLLRSPSEKGGSGTPDSSAFDRAVYLAYAKTRTPPFDRGELIRHWLDEKRAAFSKNRPLPGDLYNETMGLARILAVVTAFFFGAILAWSVLSYSGATPINIFTCVWVLVAPQVLLLALLGLSALLSRMGVSNTFKGFYPLVSMLLRRLAARARTAGQDSLSAHTRLRLNTLIDLTGRRKTPYGPAFFWPVFLLAQLFGVWFNLGLLTATGLKLAIADIAFGWQSTLFSDPATVFRMVEWFSLPWSRFVSAAHPTMAQIEGSRMILKEGMVHLATPDLVSWWPFLVYAILCYGLIPRGVLLAWGYWRHRRALVAVSFSTGACDRLIQRMQSPRLQSSALEKTNNISEQNSLSAASADPETSLTAPTAPVLTGPTGPAIVLVPEEIAHLFSDETLATQVAGALALDMAGRLSLEQDAGIDGKALKNILARHPAPPDGMRLVLVTEAWQPPLRETLAWLAGLRQAAGPQTGLIVGLVGKPHGHNRFTAPALMDRRIWEQAVAGLKDPYARVESLGGNHE